MTNRRRSAATRSVPAQTSEQLLDDPGAYPPANRVDRPAQRSRRGGRAEGDQQQLTRLSFRVQPLPSDK